MGERPNEHEILDTKITDGTATQGVEFISHYYLTLEPNTCIHKS